MIFNIKKRAIRENWLSKVLFLSPFLHYLTLIATLAQSGLQAGAVEQTGGSGQIRRDMLSDKEPKFKTTKPNECLNLTLASCRILIFLSSGVSFFLPSFSLPVSSFSHFKVFISFFNLYFLSLFRTFFLSFVCPFFFLSLSFFPYTFIQSP